MLEAADGQEAALEAAAQCGGSIALLLTDVIMPRISGPALVKLLAASRPEMKVMFMSGYEEDLIQQHGLLNSSTIFLQEPLRPETLLQKVLETLDHL